MSDANLSGDSADLEALFDSIASARPEPAAAPAPAAPAAAAAPAATNDSDDLQALFDSVAATVAPVAEPAVEVIPAAEDGEGEATGDERDRVFKRIGHMARQLHDTLHELGYDKLLEKTVHAIPDATDRLAYVANLTEQAACRVLNATDIAKPLQDELETSSRALGARWDKLYANQLSVEEFKQLAAETRAFLRDTAPQKAAATNDQLLEIMMAQDLENQLVQVLVDVIPDARRNENVNSLLNGPVISSEGRTDVVVNQQQVDDLLDSLGF